MRVTGYWKERSWVRAHLRAPHDPEGEQSALFPPLPALPRQRTRPGPAEDTAEREESDPVPRKRSRRRRGTVAPD